VSDEHKHVFKATQSKLVKCDDSTSTIILQHCDCGALDYMRIPGEWSWEEIVREPVLVKSDEQVMSEMGIQVGK
jgi:hypothetical protein